MARDKVTVLLPTQDVTQSVETDKVTKTAVTQANGIEIVNALDNKNNSLHIYIETTAVADKTLTVKAGNNYPNAMLGDLTIALKASSLQVVLLEDIARFENRDKSIYLDFNSGFTGNVWAVAKRAGVKPVETVVEEPSVEPSAEPSASPSAEPSEAPSPTPSGEG